MCLPWMSSFLSALLLHLYSTILNNSMSVFQQVRYKNIILILSFLSFQLITFLGILGYYLRTQINCEIIVVPTQDCTIRIVTPIGNTVV